MRGPVQLSCRVSLACFFLLLQVGPGCDSPVPETQSPPGGPVEVRPFDEGAGNAEPDENAAHAVPSDTIMASPSAAISPLLQVAHRLGFDGVASVERNQGMEIVGLTSSAGEASAFAIKAGDTSVLLQPRPGELDGSAWRIYRSDGRVLCTIASTYLVLPDQSRIDYDLSTQRIRLNCPADEALTALSDASKLALILAECALECRVFSPVTPVYAVCIVARIVASDAAGLAESIGGLMEFLDSCIHECDLALNIEGGEVRSSGIIAPYCPGDEVPIGPIWPGSGWEFVTWVGDTSSVRDVTIPYTVVDIEQDTTLTATFVRIPIQSYIEIELPDTQFSLNATLQWSGAEVPLRVEWRCSDDRVLFSPPDQLTTTCTVPAESNYFSVDLSLFDGDRLITSAQFNVSVNLPILRIAVDNIDPEYRQAMCVNNTTTYFPPSSLHLDGSFTAPLALQFTGALAVQIQRFSMDCCGVIEESWQVPITSAMPGIWSIDLPQGALPEWSFDGCWGGGVPGPRVVFWFNVRLLAFVGGALRESHPESARVVYCLEYVSGNCPAPSP